MFRPYIAARAPFKNLYSNTCSSQEKAPSPILILCPDPPPPPLWHNKILLTPYLDSQEAIGNSLNRCWPSPFYQYKVIMPNYAPRLHTGRWNSRKPSTIEGLVLLYLAINDRDVVLLRVHWTRIKVTRYRQWRGQREFPHWCLIDKTLQQKRKWRWCGDIREIFTNECVGR